MTFLYWFPTKIDKINFIYFYDPTMLYIRNFITKLLSAKNKLSVHIFFSNTVYTYNTVQ